MIFVTVGAQMPFDRLVRAIDEWAAANDRGEVMAQIGDTEWTPAKIQWTRFLPPADYLERMRDASALVAHAGTGSILCALELGKPILVMPRHASLQETRNDHQIATAERFRDKDGVLVAKDESELPARLEELLARAGCEAISAEASPALIDAVRSFIEQ